MKLSTVTRRVVLAGAAGLLAAPACAAEPAHDVSFAQDFDELWTTLRDRYCFFADKRTDWGKVRALYRPQAIAAESVDAFAELVRRVLVELYDAHTHLAEPADGAPRWPLYDLLAERVGGMVTIAAVKPDSAAGLAGVRGGDRVLAVDDRPIEEIVRTLSPRCLTRPDPAADTYVINAAVAGRTGMPRRMTVQTGSDTPRRLDLPLRRAPQPPNVESRRLDGGHGYIAIHSFADSAVVEAFDLALASLRDAPGLIIDVRGNGGGDTAVAKPIMGRFITAARPYARMRRREGATLSQPWTETVEPRGPFTYAGPVVVLADHWSGSMAEGFPMGMRDIGRARIVGTRMMGLGAAVFALRLDRTGVQAQYSGEPVYDTQDRPRWLLRPDVEVPEGGDILAVGIADLAAQRA